MKKIISIVIILVILLALFCCQQWTRYNQSHGLVSFTYDEATETLTFKGNGDLDKDQFGDDYYFRLWEIEKPTHVVISPGITSVKEYFFCYQIEGNTGKDRNHFDKIKTVELPDTITEIGGSAFSGTGIQEIMIPDHVKTIGDFAFDDCRQLKEVVVPEGVTTVGAMAFSECESLETLQLPSTLLTVEESLCRGCKNLTSVSVAAGVTEIKEDAFAQCVKLKDISLGGGLTKIGDGAFYHCESLSDLTLPASLKTLDAYAMVGCTRLKSVIIPSSVTDIRDKALGYDDHPPEPEDDYTKIEGFIIKGEKSSAAQAYANDNGFSFEIIG